jgi:hypothetical protein
VQATMSAQSTRGMGTTLCCFTLGIFGYDHLIVSADIYVFIFY